MRYIRIKDGIFKLIKSYDNVFFDILLPNGLWGYCKINENTKQADTIEELCDLYIYADRFDNSHRSVGKKELEMFNELFGDVGTIFGAIWTDKGLIYVAKMNNEGVMELL